MQRTLFEAEHDAFRGTVRTFMERQVAPRHADWEKAGIVDRDVWVEAGKQGLLGMDVPEELGGGGVADFRYNAVLDEEITRAGATGLGFGLHNDIVAPYLLTLGTDEQRRRWLPGFCSGELITAIAMSEPGAGSDLQRRAHARPPRRRRLGAVRLEDVHHQRHQRRPGAGGRPDRPGRRGRPGPQPARGRARDGRLRARPQPGQDRPEGAGHRRAVLRRGAAAGGEPARRGEPGLRPPDGEPPAGAAVDRGGGGGRLRAGAGADPGVREGPAGVRPADRLVPAQPLRARRADHRDDRRAHLRRRVHPPAPARQPVRLGRGDGQVVDDRPAEQGRRLAACSCTAATAT